MMRRNNRNNLRKFMMLSACIVTFVTTYTLILPAVTMEKGALICGIEVHEHSDDCYEEVLVCSLPEREGHSHGDECWHTDFVLTCELPEHLHADECLDEEGNMICELEEHEHLETCYEEIRTLTCSLEEAEGHQHEASCYEEQLTCGREQHVHMQSCYEEIEPETEQILIPKMMLQPLVENSIKHGMRPDGLHITVRAFGTEQAFTIRVTDDGRGFDPARMEERTARKEQPGRSRAESGIGLENIRQRLRLYYGTQAELRTGSENGRTTVEIERRRDRQDETDPADAAY